MYHIHGIGLKLVFTFFYYRSNFHHILPSQGILVSYHSLIFQLLNNNGFLFAVINQNFFYIFLCNSTTLNYRMIRNQTLATGLMYRIDLKEETATSSIKTTIKDQVSILKNINLKQGKLISNSNDH